MDASQSPSAGADDSAETTPGSGAPYPHHLTIEAPYKPGIKRVKTDRWIKQEYHDREVERIWKKVWQMTCREEEIPEVGDYILYDVADLSFIVMRTAAEEIRAYWNSCPHRGRKLREYEGNGVSELRCMFHGWSWNIDGTNKAIPCKWDFPGIGEESNLVQAKTGTWGGWVFINPDLDAEPLADFLGSLPEHFEGANHDMSKRWKQVHVAAIVDANWKVAQEAFIESWHVTTTHPQLVFEGQSRQSTGGRWDDFGNWMRAAPNTPADKQPPKPGWTVMTEDQQVALDSYYDRHLNEEPPVVAHPGQSSTALTMANIRNFYRGVIGDKIDEYHDIELMGGGMVHIWPNFHPWSEFSRIQYLFRPYGRDPDKSVMDVMLLAPWPEDKPRPAPAKAHWLKPGEDTSSAPELGQLARIFLQDIANMPRVQEGLKTSGRGYVIFSEHHEAPVRHLHDLYEKWMGLEDGE
ncbi:MAG: hypothetical protein JWO15_2234 [Sphingomonadales bacterium]|nr:hypothetical protein [Sphingomonadales bacterium]